MHCWQNEQGPQCGVEELQGSRRGPRPSKEMGDCLLSVCVQGMVLENSGCVHFQIKKSNFFQRLCLSGNFSFSSAHRQKLWRCLLVMCSELRAGLEAVTLRVPRMEL